jgi:mRNA-degrading endonuclease YafQ of YafQ-DinJ toxin-antitoxin module
MKYKVRVKNEKKTLTKLPKNIKDMLYLLIDDLEREGPIQPEWQNYSKLGKNKYHCHLSYSWVACWKIEKNSFIIEVYYAGSREKAPY